VTATLDTLWKTFGVLGGLSAAAWLAAVVWLVAGIGRGRRWQAWLTAAVAAAVGLGLATAVSRSIRSIEVDRSAEVQAAENTAAQRTQTRLEGRAVGIRFAEDTAADRADRAGLSAAEAEGAYERAVAEELAKIPAYRSRGKQARGAKTAAASGTAALGSATSGTAALSDTAATPADGETAAAETAAPARSLPEAELIVADRYDRANRGIAWLVFSMAVALCGWEYIRRFNTPFEAVWPLPLAGTLVDGLATKERVAAVPPGLPGGLPRFLETAVRKGETFILFTAADPFPGRDALDRVVAGPAAWRLPKRTFPAADVGGDPELARLVFESAWFDRAAFVLTGDEAADDVLTGVVAALARRQHSRAMMQRTLNLVWALPAEPPPAALADLVRLADQVNVRWLRDAVG
jgi:hypothetical protein